LALPLLRDGASVVLLSSSAASQGAATALFLASAQSSFTTGAELFVDGGVTQI
jgi:enoyl-[acyl-carrier-protein] reductase (NADH)